MRSLDRFEKSMMKKKPAQCEVGDTIDVHVKIIEGDKERVQIFSGVVLAKRHGGLSEMITVRRIVQGEGVERIFPLYSPRLVKMVIRKRGKVRRAKLHYLRERIGRRTKVEEKVGADLGAAEETPLEPAEKSPAESSSASAGHGTPSK